MGRWLLMHVKMRPFPNGLSWASRPQEAVVGESNIGGPGGRERAGVGSAVAVIRRFRKKEGGTGFGTATAAGARRDLLSRSCAVMAVAAWVI